MASKTTKTKAEIEQENEMLKQLLAQLTANNQAQPQEDKTKSNKRDVTLTSLVEGKLVLRNGNRFVEVDGQFGSIKLTKAQARELVEQNQQAYIKGFFVLDGIGNELDDLFTSYELDQMQCETISPKQLQDVFNQPLETIEEIYKRVSNSTKATMRNMLQNKILGGKKVNIQLKELMTNLTGFDYINLEPYDDDTLQAIRQHGGEI